MNRERLHLSRAWTVSPPTTKSRRILNLYYLSICIHDDFPVIGIIHVTFLCPGGWGANGLRSPSPMPCGIPIAAFPCRTQRLRHRFRLYLKSPGSQHRCSLRFFVHGHKSIVTPPHPLHVGRDSHKGALHRQGPRADSLHRNSHEEGIGTPCWGIVSMSFS